MFTNPTTYAAAGLVVDYELDGSPAALGQSGMRGFCSNSDGVIRYQTPSAGPAAANNTCAGWTALQ